jgi:MFS family permease
LRLVAFRRLLAAYVLNELAWSVGTLALSVLVYRRTGSAIGSAGFFLCSQVVPALLSPALVVKLDRLAPRRVLPALYGLEAVLFGVLAWMTHHFTLVPMLALALADGIVASTARSLASATRTDILKPHDLLPEGNAVATFGFSAALMAGPVIGGAVVAAGGTIDALLVNCGLFAGMALILSITQLPAAKTHHGSVLGRLREGLAHARDDRVLKWLLVMQALGLIFFTVTIPVEVVYAQHTLKAGPGGYGALLGVWGGGAVAGSAVYARWRRRSPSVLIGGSAAALGIGFATMAVAPSLAIALVGAAIGGAGNSVESIAARTAVQERTPDRWMALMMSLMDSMSQLAPGIGIVLGGVITQLTTSRAAFAAAHRSAASGRAGAPRSRAGRGAGPAARRIARLIRARRLHRYRLQHDSPARRRLRRRDVGGGLSGARVHPDRARSGRVRADPGGEDPRGGPGGRRPAGGGPGSRR